MQPCDVAQESDFKRDKGKYARYQRATAADELVIEILEPDRLLVAHSPKRSPRKRTGRFELFGVRSRWQFEFGCNGRPCSLPTGFCRVDSIAIPSIDITAHPGDDDHQRDSN